MIKRVHNLVMVLMRPIGRLFDKRVGSSFLWRRMVREFFHEDGVVPVSQNRMNRCRREDLNEAGMRRISSFGMPSGPGVLLFFSLRRTESKVY